MLNQLRWPLTALLATTVIVIVVAVLRPAPVDVVKVPQLQSAEEIERELAKFGLQDEEALSILSCENIPKGPWARAAKAGGPKQLAAALRQQMQGGERGGERRRRWLFSEARDEKVFAPSAAAGRLLQDEAELYPLEVAALVRCIAHNEGLAAFVTEVLDTADAKQPLDPTGHFGYYAVAIGRSGEAFGSGQLPDRAFDVYGGAQALAVPKESIRVLSGAELVAAAASQKAMQVLLGEHDPTKALVLATQAVKVDPKSPSAKTVEGMALLATGAQQEGMASLEAAVELRPDAARKNNIAQIYIAQGQLERAGEEASAALKLKPEYGAAHGVLGALALAKGETEEALRELELAEKFGANPAAVARTRASVYLADGEEEKARAEAERAVSLRPKDLQARLLLAQLYRQAAEYDKMREQVQQALAHVPAEAKTRLKMIIGQMLGPTALEGSMEGGAATADLVDPSASLVDPSANLSADALPDPEEALKLRDPSMLEEPGLKSQPGGFELKLGDPSSVRLRDPEQKLKLD